MPARSSNSPVGNRALLTEHWLFAALSDAELDRVVSHMHHRRYAPNELIFRKGDPGSSMMAIGKGRVKISSTSAEGRTVVLNILGRGEIFGEIALLDGGQRTADATAIEATELHVLDSRDFIPLLQRHPEICIKLLKIFCARLRSTSEQVEDQLFLTRPVRLAKVLLRLAAEYGHESPEGVRLEIRLSQSGIGDLAGMTRESVNKQIAAWRDAGLVDVVDGKIVVREMERLRSLVEASLP